MKTRSGADLLELRIPPLALVFTVALLIWLAGLLVPRFNFEFPFRAIVALGLGLLGFTSCAMGISEFRRAKTTVNPTRPQSASSLVTSGIYGRTRNAMYLGFLLMLTGWALFNANSLALLGPVAFIAYMNRFQIGPEERALTALFGGDFKNYCSRVRRWI